MEQIKRKRTIYEVVFKRPLDFILSLIALIILSPVLLIVAILVKIKLGGPVIFKQKRPGKNEKIFTLYKFRTMTNERDEEGNLKKEVKRITKFGNILRKLSLDELPSLLNILKGDMSFVGPRPLLTSYLDYYDNEEQKRQLVRPGLTGLAQVKGRNSLTWEERFKYDLKYIDNITLIKDIKIIIQTFIKVLRKEDIVEFDDPNIRKPLNLQRSTLKREIGSYFWIDKERLLFENNDFKKLMKKKIGGWKDQKYLSTGREAIRFILNGNKIETKVALLPYYTCSSVLSPFMDSGFKILYYNLDDNMSINIEEIKTIINKESIGIFLFHNYFGFKTNSNIDEIVEMVKSKGTIVIEDITQNLYSDYQHTNSDYFFGSIRKWYGLPDGAILISKNNKLYDGFLPTNDELVKNNLNGFYKKHKYIKGESDSKDSFLKIFKKSEKIINENKCIHTISNKSLKIIKSKNIANIQVRRKNNYKTLLKGLKINENIEPLFSTLEDNVTPLYFVVRSKNRSELQKYLIQKNIYCPIIWPKPSYIKDKLSKETTSLYNELLSIPCDQRYDEVDMLYIIDKINAFYN